VNPILVRLERELSHEILFDDGIEAARNACVAGASIAAAAIVAAAYSDSPLVGLPALRECMRQVESLPLTIDAWQTAFNSHRDAESQELVFAPGFGHVTEQQAAFLLSVCERVSACISRNSSESRTKYYLSHHHQITSGCGPINRVGLMSLVCVDQRVSYDDAEHMFVVLRIKSAISEAQKVRHDGLAQFPFLSEQFHYEGQWPTQQTVFAGDYVHQIGLE
jgi:hypothetical protein